MANVSTINTATIEPAINSQVGSRSDGRSARTANPDTTTPTKAITPNTENTTTVRRIR